MNESQETLPKPEAGQTLAPLACSAQIADHTGYHFHKCNRPAKYMVGAYGPRCGLHAQGKWFKGLRKPIAPNDGAQRQPAANQQP